MSLAKSSKFHFSSPPIPGLSFFSITEVCGAVYAFGGVQRKAFTSPTTPGIDNLYRFDIQKLKWVQVAKPAQQTLENWPYHRFAHSAVAYGSKLIIYGGTTYTDNGCQAFISDCWAFNTRS